MAIQWYPGHMHKAQKQIREVMPNVDLVIEVLDARLPYSSNNPLVFELRGGTPCLKILNKSDLADPQSTQQWIDYLQQTHNVRAVALDQQKQTQVQSILTLIRQMVPNKGSADKPITALICGIPNVGKSTLINALAGRIIAKTGNEPAVTKAQQKIRLDGYITLLDTPGILWPKFDNENSGYRLAASGAIKDTAISHDDVAAFAGEYLLAYYPQRLKERYGWQTLPSDEIDLLETLGRQRGCLVRGGHVDFTKVATILLSELREGTLGPITLEHPEQIEAEEAHFAQLRQEKEEQKKQHNKQRRANAKKRRR
ncbi:ribosome biogenesis GTPase YlqF [Celerinatantimonas diazotrophica]|uniref:Ribosome biogenesis GTPase A n=1 Tax=Celerinatantimonas diazotrophica TaxID=412034 RepID=A0A4R1KDJ0_9GAMM|nr:ribosome biogenesis GTPase YlqF [Celerinatantimonas diazotrophica]TCK62738.1 ribosome biogenesis GTPase A [Celerinatantimonas diazotrophica]CAG9298368.1 Ribosome biogenesis GTPase A [Celerinatantimonas diazotrophica]